ncbi:MAG: DUF551 domain-containing protein [Clostridia bacterium]|nr:DUF551 domain-containing protein [Clostridia bacterium]
MDINKLKLPDDWAKDYESPVTVQIRKIAEQLEEQRENELILKISEQMGVNIDKDELTRALAYDRDQYRRGYEDGWRARSKEVPQWVPVENALPEDMQRVLIWFEYYRYGDFNCMYQTYGFGYVCDGKWSPFINGETGWQDYRVIAWQPLPEPYKEEGETND